MNFIVTYRDKSGALREERVEAASRAECVAECRRRGIAPVGIKEGKGGDSRRVRDNAPHQDGGRGATALPGRRSLMAAGVGVLLIVLGGAWWWLGGGQGDSRRVRDNAPHQSGNERDARSTSGRDGARPSQVDSRRVGDNAPRQGGGRGATALPGRDGAPTPQDEPKTNNVQWIVPPLDPDDPDNALRTRTAQELGSILSVTPGDPIPPFPYAFLVEDEQKASGEPADNGNNSFLDSLRKIQIRAKETDSDSITKHKEKLVAAQMELLDGIKEGLSVNDTIRSAYEFRVRAHEYRNSAIETLREWAAENPTRADFDRTLAELNAKLSEEGIKTIPPEEVVPELEDEAQEAQAQGAEAQGAEKK